jgi:hypothetical protein
MTPHEAINLFLSSLYPQRHGHLNIWTDAGHKSQWFDLASPSAFNVAAAYAVATNGTANVWYMTGLTASDLGPSRKGTEADVIRVPALHADVDYGTEGHKANALPPTEEDAHTIIAAAPLPPSMIIHSGHGLQPYWLLDDAADVSTPEKRSQVKGILTRWQAHMRDFAKSKGWNLDGTANLDRLMRIPGTYNRKADPVPVRIIKRDGPRYSLAQLEAALPAEEDLPPPSHGDDAAATSIIIPDPAAVARVTPPASPDPDHVWSDVGTEADFEIVRRARSAANGEKFSRLHDGGIDAGYPSRSEAVQALASLLAFYTKDASQIDRILYASKICEAYDKCSRKKWREGTIQKALAFVQQVNATEAPTAPCKVSMTDLLVRQAETVALFHDADNAYASVTIQGRTEHMPVKSESFGRWLLGKYWTTFRKAPSEKAKAEALATIAARATFEGPQHEVAIRLAEHDGRVYLDLSNDRGEAVEVTADGWRVTTDPPVRFVRRAGMLPLPTPTKGGNLSDLRPLLNAADDDVWMFCISWLLGALRPQGPYPLLLVSGEQGSAKSNMCKLLRSIIDPNAGDVRSAPASERDLFIAANNAHIIALENLSGLKPELSDSLCRLATGAAYSSRKLYSDREEEIISICRPVLINGIGDLATRADLLERSIMVTLPMIPPTSRRTEADIRHAFDAARPGILGALLTAVSAALRCLPNVTMEEKPRMADFALWIAAAEKGGALPWSEGDFMKAYMANQAQSQGIALDTAAIVPAIERLLSGHGGSWEGLVGKLWTTLNDQVDSRSRPKDWPQTARGLGNQLRRLAPSLRLSKGIEITISDRTKAGFVVTLRDTQAEPHGNAGDFADDAWS